MFQSIFNGVDFSCFYEKEAEQYMLYWPKYDIDIRLKGDEALLFKQQIEMIYSEPQKDVKEKFERIIKIYFYFKYACPVPRFKEE